MQQQDRSQEGKRQHIRSRVVACVNKDKRHRSLSPHAKDGKRSRSTADKRQAGAPQGHPAKDRHNKLVSREASILWAQALAEGPQQQRRQDARTTHNVRLAPDFLDTSDFGGSDRQQKEAPQGSPEAERQQERIPRGLSPGSLAAAVKPFGISAHMEAELERLKRGYAVLQHANAETNNQLKEAVEEAEAAKL